MRKKARRNWTDVMQRTLVPFEIGDSVTFPIGDRFYHRSLARKPGEVFTIEVTKDGLKITLEAA